ncbi:dATP/dGTP pyrophosphohydrolase domain-containing protein [Dyadobacter sp. Leaf189]|uniref:dATP/dGTP pyrophosphohydrolase domain-containing protein n=1 Tax=Dyadobacter sp. Leaf189 TaxID=1736295 RepID=UPI00138F1E36|nr:dATP/dGTP pyrophosphohydrolase domain-containing protein [Dyadobacter sp. Leaf189]
MKQSTRIGTKHLADMETERLAWSLKTFADATPISSLRKLESEIAEIEKNIEGGIKDPEEYADAMMCLLDSAGRDGITVAEILSAFEIKLDKNKLRKWRKNPDDSYSHVKD